MKKLIRKNDTTTHGGKILGDFSHTDFNGEPLVGVGHRVFCPLCKASFPILEGSETFTMNGVPVALEGMKTACGATLIAGDPKGEVIR
ncbi:PAAR domain-containing protein [Pseudomonas sp. v388]|uniref:PAAR domain-containing protein n=1 Tax=Pseudomonas sp. v388 TaxID=2479849 RepID=UPI000F7854A3|nr:PAAR domain-containing protein [Pseudomonas sp. v388]RRV05645.1 PAAR domain-containing protein [Pseudomonas sp. v388]